jgi:hypothetical protein
LAAFFFAIEMSPPFLLRQPSSPLDIAPYFFFFLAAFFFAIEGHPLPFERAQ